MQRQRRSEGGADVAALEQECTDPNQYHSRQDDEVVEEVLVTGSRIARRDFSANSPIQTVDDVRFEESSTIAMESVLNQLPQFVPAVRCDSGRVGTRTHA